MHQDQVTTPRTPPHSETSRVLLRWALSINLRGMITQDLVNTIRLWTIWATIRRQTARSVLRKLDKTFSELIQQLHSQAPEHTSHLMERWKASLSVPRKSTRLPIHQVPATMIAHLRLRRLARRDRKFLKPSAKTSGRSQWMINQDPAQTIPVMQSRKIRASSSTRKQDSPGRKLPALAQEHTRWMTDEL